MSDRERRELERSAAGGDADARSQLRHAHRREGYANAVLLPDVLRTHPLAPSSDDVLLGPTCFVRDTQGLPMSLSSWRKEYENVHERQVILTTFLNGVSLSTVWEGLVTSMFSTAVVTEEGATEVARHETVEEARGYHKGYAGAMEAAVKSYRLLPAAPRVC